jgi:hypothetical protein
VVEVAAFGKDKAEATMSGTLQAGNEDMGAGEEISGVSSPFDGLIDEIRISTVVRPDAWLKATYRTCRHPRASCTRAPGNRKVEVVRRRRPAAYRHDELHLRSARLHRQLVDLPLGWQFSTSEALNRADWCRQKGALSRSCAQSAPTDETNRGS